MKNHSCEIFIIIGAGKIFRQIGKIHKCSPSQIIQGLGAETTVRGVGAKRAESAKHKKKTVNKFRQSFFLLWFWWKFHKRLFPWFKIFSELFIHFKEKQQKQNQNNFVFFYTILKEKNSSKWIIDSENVMNHEKDFFEREKISTFPKKSYGLLKLNIMFSIFLVQKCSTLEAHNFFWKSSNFFFQKSLFHDS